MLEFLTAYVLLGSLFAMILYNVFICLKIETHYLTTVFSILIPATGIYIRALKTECAQSTSVFYGCVQSSWCQARQMQRVNKPIDNEEEIRLHCSIFCH